MLGQYVYIPFLDQFGAVQRYFARDCDTHEHIWIVRLDCGCCQAWAADSDMLHVGLASPELAARCVEGGQA